MGLSRKHGVLMADRMPEFTPFPDGTVRKLTGEERREVYYHGFHDTPNVLCRSCLWEQAI